MHQTPKYAASAGAAILSRLGPTSGGLTLKEIAALFPEYTRLSIFSHGRNWLLQNKLAAWVTGKGKARRIKLTPRGRIVRIRMNAPRDFDPALVAEAVRQANGGKLAA